MKGTFLVAALGAVAIVGGCSAAASPPAGVTATLSEFKVALDSAKAKAGNVTFTIKNGGTIAHEFVIKKTALASDKLPVATDGGVDEESADLAQVDEKEDIGAGTNATLAANLTPGHYVLFCNLPGHYKGGMHADIDVVASS